MQYGTRRQRCSARIAWDDEIDVLGSESGTRLDLRFDIAGQVSKGPGIHLEVQLREIGPAPGVGSDGCDLADLDAAQLDLRAVLHAQTRPVGNQRERNGF